MADGWTIRGEKIQRHGWRGVNCEARERKIGGRGQGEGEGEGEKWARSPVGHREDSKLNVFSATALLSSQVPYIKDPYYTKHSSPFLSTKSISNRNPISTTIVPVRLL